MTSKWMMAALGMMVWAGVGCSDEVEHDEAPERLMLDGKGDLSSGVNLRGDLEFGASVEGELSRDFEMHAYTISAKRGAILELDVTHRGSSSRLDTLLYLYAPTDEGYVRIARDDESGWGQLSRLGIELRKDGDFLAVIGTQDGEGRGKYRLELTCGSGDCALVTPPPVADCHDALYTQVAECVIAGVTDATYQGFEPYADVAAEVDYCTSREQALGYHEMACQLGDEAWCFEDFDAYFVEQVMPICDGIARDEFVVANSAGLAALPMRELADIEVHRNDACTELGGCEIELVAIQYSGSPSLEEIAESARAFTGRPWETTVIGEVDAESRIEDFYDLDMHLSGMVEEITDLIGSREFEAVGMQARHELNWDTTDEHTTLLHFPSQKKAVLVIQQIFY